MSDMQRREFVTALGGVTAMWPFTARARQSERMRRIGVPMSTSADDPAVHGKEGAFTLSRERELKVVDYATPKWGKAVAANR